MPTSDFDFLFGRWHVRHRRLETRLTECTTWLEFTGTCTARALLDGLANVDDNVLEMPTGHYRAVTLRAYDPGRATWSIWWLDGRTPGHLDPPVVGGFVDGVGTFYADDTLDGRPIRVRFRWSVTDRSAPHWEQAFSGDGGEHWETNWHMDFTPRRIEDPEAS